jgi:DNA mismatch endonuclease, patch repair protein
MQAIKSRNTTPELAVRSLLHSLGYRFRLHRRDLPGTPDIVLPARRCVIFVNGCFWHAHGCRIGQPPKSRLEYWQPKLDANKARDLRKLEEVEYAGWRALTVWQCELRDLDSLATKLKNFCDVPIGLRSTKRS